MKRKTVVLLSSVLAGALLVGGTFAAFAVTDLASPKGADYTPGPHEEPEETTYVTLEWGQGSVLTGIDQLENNELRKAGVVGLKSSTAYDGLFQVVISDKTPNTVVKGEEDPKLIDHFNVYVYEGKDANPETATLLGQLPDPAVQEDHQRELKLYLGGQNTADGHQVTVYVKIAGLSDEDFAKVSQDVVHLEVDWAMNDKDGESYHYDNKVVYFAKPAEFGAKMYAHSWNATSTTTWPGTEMALDAATGLYKVDVPANHTNIIFNDGEKKLPTEEDDPTGQGYLFTGYDLTKGYVYWDSTSWQMLPVNADVTLFSLEKNGEAVPAATLAGYINNDPEVKQDNNVVYDIALAANDKLEFSYDGEPIYFCTSNDLGQDVLVDTEKTFDYAATYRFYINRFNHIFVQAQDEPVPPTPVIANNIIYGLQGSAVQWGKIADLVAHNEYEVKAEEVSLAAGDKFLFHLEGDSWMKYSNLKTEGEGSAHAHFTSDDEGNLVVVTGGTFDFYVLKEGEKTIWSTIHSEEPVVGYSATLNGQALDLSDKAATYNPDQDNAAYQLELANTDVLVFKYGEDVLNFCHWDAEQQKVVIDSQEYTPEEAGTYKFVINKSNEIFVEQEETPVAENIIFGSKAGAAWGKIADLVDHVEGEVKALNVELAAGDKFVFHLEGDSWMKYSNLKTEGEGSAHAHFTTDEEDNLIVVTGGTFDFYVLKEGEKTIWSTVHGEEPEPTVGYTATLNGQALDLSDKGQTYDPAENNAVYLLDLAANDVLAFKNGETDLHFYHWDKEQEKAIDEGATFTVETAGQYDIYINTDNQIYVGAHVEPSAEGEYHIVGTFCSWDYNEGAVTTKLSDTHFQATGVQLTAGAEVKATDGTTWLGVASDGDNYTKASNGNAILNVTGTFTIDVYTDSPYGNHLVFTKTA